MKYSTFTSTPKVENEDFFLLRFITSSLTLLTNKTDFSFKTQLIMVSNSLSSDFSCDNMQKLSTCTLNSHLSQSKKK